MKNGGKTHELVGETHNRTLTQPNQQQDFKQGYKLNTTNSETNKCRGYGAEGSRKRKKRYGCGL